MEKQLLNSDFVEKEVKKILASYPEISYNLDTSHTTLSIYIRMFYKDCKNTIRISDHLTSKTDIKTLIIAKHTKLKTLQNFVKNAIRKLELTSTLKRIKEIK